MTTLSPARPVAMDTAFLPSAAPADDESRLVTEVRSGCPLAAESLVEATYAKLYAACHRMTGSTEEAADLVQETYRKAWRALPEFRGEARFSTTLRFAKGAWEPPIKSYQAAQTKVPAPQLPYASFTTRGAATLRAAPVVDDKPNPSGDDAGEESSDRSATLRGNVVATYAAGARGTVLASEGTWRYLASIPRPGRARPASRTAWTRSRSPATRSPATGSPATRP